jgi:hypothetical protein
MVCIIVGCSSEIALHFVIPVLPHTYIRAAYRSRCVSSSSSSSSSCSFHLHSPQKSLAQYLSTYRSPALNNTSTINVMLQLLQRRAANYPTFPGNVEALSIPSSSPEPLQECPPSPPSSPPPTSTTTTQYPESSASLGKPKRRQTLAACQHCRRRKSKVGFPLPRPTKS